MAQENTQPMTQEQIAAKMQEHNANTQQIREQFKAVIDQHKSEQK